MKKPPDEQLFEDLQDRIRKGGYRRNPDGSYQTNEGAIFLESPHEAGRRAIYAKSKETRQHYFYKGVRDPATEAAAQALASDPDLDIDWGIYAPEPEKRPMLLYGNCRGGPYDGRPIAHHEPILVVVLDKFTKGVLPGQVGPSQLRPDVVYKAYVWQPAISQWQWDDSERQPPETAK